MSDDLRHADAIESIVDLIARRSLTRYEDEYKKANGGKTPTAKACEAHRQTVLANPLVRREAAAMLAQTAGVARQEDLLDSLAVLLWGAAGSLIAAWLWELRALVPALIVLVLLGALWVQFRGSVRKYAWPRRLLLALASAAALAGAVYLVGLDVITHPKRWAPPVQSPAEPDRGRPSPAKP
jgi:hypothetical protein